MERPRMIRRISAAEAIVEARKPGTLLLDVRSATEIAASGTADGALCIPAFEVGRRMRAEDDADAKAIRNADCVILFCAVGARAEAVAEQLAGFGLADVRVFSAFRDWAMEGGPIRQVA